MGLSVADGFHAADSLQERFPDAVVGRGEYAAQAWVELAPERLVEICRFLRDEPQLGFDQLLDVTAVHWPHDMKPFEIVHHLYSYARNDRLRLKTRIAGLSVPSVSSLWKSAEWNERETYDMFGIRFEGHPDLRRILMPDDYTDFPLRKEFPLFRG